MKRMMHTSQIALFFASVRLLATTTTMCEAKLGGVRAAEAEPAKDIQRKLFILNSLGSDPDPELLPLGICQGDCDDDDDCAEGLVCFQRDANETVPGCQGGEFDTSRSDFCILDAPSPTVSPTRSTSPTNPPTPKPSAGPTKLPTPTPSVAPSESPPAPPVEPFGAIEYVGNEGTFYARYPMGPCKGDCDDDSDCADGLYCHQRGSFGAVPYCTGGETESSTADFCAWDGQSTRPEPTPEIPEDYFRLKLYWEVGYNWQNETIEREWCMMYDFDGYPGTGLCWIGDTNERCNTDRVYVGKCIDDAQQWFTFVNVTDSDSTVEEALIMTGDGQRCFQRKEREISLENCNPNNKLQRWFALNGSLSGPKFELSQLGYTSQCVTNDHHPKSGEIVELHHCESSRSPDSQSSFWEKF